MSKVVNDEYPKSNKQVSDAQLKAMATAQYQSGTTAGTTDEKEKSINFNPSSKPGSSPISLSSTCAASISRKYIDALVLYLNLRRAS